MKFKLVKSKIKLYARLLAASITAGLLSIAGIAEADDVRSDAKDVKSVGITLMPVTAQGLPDDPKQTLTAFMVYLTPEAAPPAIAMQASCLCMCSKARSALSSTMVK